MLSKDGLILLRELIKLKTVDGNKIEQKKALKMIANYLKTDFVCKYFSHNGYESALYLPKKFQNIDILLSAHMDVVPAPDNLFNVKKKGDKLIGRGTFDMKGPLVALVEALTIHCKNKDDINVGLLVTSDEEKGGLSGTNYFLNTFDYQPKVVIIPDGGNNFEIVTEEKGVLNIELTATGSHAHTARPWEGVNATSNLITAINKIIELYPVGTKKDWQTTASVVAFESENIANNVVPAFAKAKINIRNIGKDSPEAILKSIKKNCHNIIIKSKISGCAITIAPHTRQIKVFRNCVKNYTGKLPKLVNYSSTCDARYFTARSMLTIITRPPGGGAHQNDEWVSIDGLNKFTNILVDFLEQSSKKI